MPKVMTDAYRNATFILLFTDDKRECVFVKPLSDTDLSNIRRDAAKEAGADDALFNSVFLRQLLQKAITGWEGFYDVAGEQISYSLEMVKVICEYDPEFAMTTALRIRNVARLGELDERKN